MPAFPVGAGQDTGERISEYFICNRKVNQDGASEFHILGSIDDKVLAQIDSRPNILTRAMSEIDSDDQQKEMTQPDIVKAEELISVGKLCFVAEIDNSNVQPITTATYAAQEPPRSEISSTHSVYNDGLTKATENEFIFKPMAMATQETVDPEQEPPKEQFAPNFEDHQVPCGTGRRWSADPDEGFYSTNTEWKPTLRLDSAVKSYRVDESQINFSLNEEFDPMEMLNPPSENNRSVVNGSAHWHQMDLEQISKDSIKEFWDIEMRSVQIPRGQNHD